MIAGYRRGSRPPVTGHVLAYDPSGYPGDHAPVRHPATDHRACGDHHVPPDARAGKHDGPRAEPASRADGHRRVARPLPPDRQLGIGVAVVLVGDVDVRAGVDVIPDHNGAVGDDVAAPADNAAVTDAKHRLVPEILPGNHPGTQADLLTNQRSGADRDPGLAVQG